MPGKNMDHFIDPDAARALGINVLHHLKDMYPEALKAVPRSAELSLKNFVAREVTAHVKEVLDRVKETIDCLPSEGEPAFTLLGRDPQAPDLVLRWVKDRAIMEPDDVQKHAKAVAIAEKMLLWKVKHPEPGLAAEKYDAFRKSDQRHQV